MAHAGSFGTAMELRHLALQIRIDVQYALVLAQMLGPGFDHEPFGDQFGIRGILGHAPSVSAIAQALRGQALDRAKKRQAASGGNAVFDQDEHRTAIMLDRRRDERLGPVIGGNQVDISLR